MLNVFQSHISEKCKIRFSPSTASGNYKLGTRVSNDNISTTFSNSISDKVTNIFHRNKSSIF